MTTAELLEEIIRIEANLSAARLTALHALRAQIGTEDAVADTDDAIPFDRPPKTSAETLEGKILTALQKLGYSEDALNRWCARQFPEFRLDKDDWSEMSQERKLMVLATFEGKVAEKAVTR